MRQAQRALKKLLERYTQREIGERADLAQSCVSDILKGRMTWRTYEKLRAVGIV